MTCDIAAQSGPTCHSCGTIRLPAASGCRSRAARTSADPAARLVRGEVDHGNAAVLDDDFADGLMLACQATPLSDEFEVES